MGVKSVLLCDVCDEECSREVVWMEGLFGSDDSETRAEFDARMAEFNTRNFVCVECLALMLPRMRDSALVAKILRGRKKT